MSLIPVTVAENIRSASQDMTGIIVIILILGFYRAHSVMNTADSLSLRESFDFFCTC